MKGSVHRRGSKWYYKFRSPERDPSTGGYPWITKGGFDTEREAWKPAATQCAKPIAAES